MFRRPSNSSVQRTLWPDATAPKSVPADRPLPPVSFDRAFSSVDANDLLSTLKLREGTAELRVLHSTLDFVNAILANNCPGIQEKMDHLIALLESFKENHPNETRGAFAYCTGYLTTNLAICASSNPQFKAFYLGSDLKRYLDNARPQTQSPPKPNSSPSRR